MSGLRSITLGAVTIALGAALAIAAPAGADTAPATPPAETVERATATHDRAALARSAKRHARRLRQSEGVRKPPRAGRAKASKLTLRGKKTNKTARLSAITFDLNPATYEFVGYAYYNDNWVRLAVWLKLDGAGLALAWIEQWERWNGYRYVAYSQYTCPTGTYGAHCYRNW